MMTDAPRPDEQRARDEAASDAATAAERNAVIAKLRRTPLMAALLQRVDPNTPDLQKAVRAAIAAIAAQRHAPEDILKLEQAVNRALEQLPISVLTDLFYDELEIGNLPSDAFSTIVSLLDSVARAEPESRELQLRTLWSWYWEREVLALRRFRRTGGSDHDVLMQRPYFWRPGLTSKPFWEPEELPWLRRLEEAYSDIYAELQAVRRQQAWQPYRPVEYPDLLIRYKNSDNYSDWNGFFFYHPFHGKFVGNHESCPRTSELIESIPRLCRDDLVLFSALSPKRVIPPHCGPINGRLRVHLCLTGANGCFLRVGTQIRQWQDGKVLVFDDSFEHQVCHNGDQTRVVLMLNVLQPDMPDEEAAFVQNLATKNMKVHAEDAQQVADRLALSRSKWWT